MITSWLSSFKQHWLGKDIEKVLALFSSDADYYYETPFLKFNNQSELKAEWEGVKKLDDMKLETDVYATDENRRRYAIQWKFSYTKEGKMFSSAGVYLVGLRPDGLCDYFLRCAVKPQDL